MVLYILVYINFVISNVVITSLGEEEVVAPLDVCLWLWHSLDFSVNFLLLILEGCDLWVWHYLENFSLFSYKCKSQAELISLTVVFCSVGWPWGSVSIGGRLITNFRLEEEGEADVLVDRLGTATTTYKMEIVPGKTKVMTDNPNSLKKEIKIKAIVEIKSQRLETLKSPNPFFCPMIAQATTALSRLRNMYDYQFSWHPQ